MDLLYRIEMRAFGKDRLLVIALPVWGVFAWIAAYKKGNFRCPRCGESFFVAWDNRRWHQGLRNKLWTRKCLHCGLPKWTIAAPQSAADYRGIKPQN